jgi:hypothetical protein
MSLQTVWTWTLRLALPLLVGVLAAALHVIWADSPYAHGLLDIFGTIGLVIAMLGMAMWCAAAWLGEPETTTPDRSEMRP